MLDGLTPRQISWIILQVHLRKSGYEDSSRLADHGPQLAFAPKDCKKIWVRALFGGLVVVMVVLQWILKE